MRWDKVPPLHVEKSIQKKTGDASFRLIASFLAMLPVPAFVNDKRGHLLYLNTLAEKFWKLKSREAIGKTFVELFENDKVSREVSEADSIVSRRGAAHVYFHHVADPHRYSVMTFPFASESGGYRFFGGIVIEHTEKADK